MIALNINKNKVKKQINGVITSILRTIILIGLAFIVLYPLIESIIPAITDYSYLGHPNSIWIPAKFGMQAFLVAMNVLNYFPSLLQNMLYAFLIMIIQVFLSAIVGYGFAHIRFRGSNIIFGLVVLTIIVPGQATILPQYLNFRTFDVFGIIEAITGAPLNLLGNQASLYLLAFLGQGLRSGLFIYLFRQFFMGLPKELEEAALVDGCGYLRTFFRIVLPNAVPMMITVGVFSFVWNFGDTFYINTFMSDQEIFLSQYISNRFTTDVWIFNAFRDLAGLPNDANVNPLLLGATSGAAKMLLILPLLIMYFIVQKKFVQSFERSGITG